MVGSKMGGNWPSISSGSGLSIWTRGCRLWRFWPVLVPGALMVGVTLSLWCSSALAVSVEEESVSNVASSSATLHALVNPEGSATKYRFEYGTDESYGTSVPEAEGEISAGTSGVAVEEVHLQDLKPHTRYHFRIVASSENGDIARGVDETFITQSGDTGQVLPDGRVWELVSPATKDGALMLPIEEGGGLVQAAEDGGAITYLSVGPAKSGQEEPPGNGNETQILSVRDNGGGWSSSDMATPHEVTTGISVGEGQEYRDFSPDLSVGLVQPFGSGEHGLEAEGAAPLSEGASEKTIYLRADTPLPPSPGSSEQAGYLEAGEEGDYLPLVTGCPPAGEECKPKVEARANAPPGTKIGGAIEFAGASPGLDHVVLSSRVPLAPEAETSQLYEWTAGKSPKESLQLASVLPNNTSYSGTQAQGAQLGNGRDIRGAVSSDGSHIFWSYEGHLFMRDMSSGQSLQLDAPEGGVAPSVGKANFQFANSDGSEIFFTDEERLTADSTAENGAPDLYECEIVEEVGELKCHLEDLTINIGESADVQGVTLVGSNNTSYVYFVTNGVLADAENENGQGGKASPGSCKGENPPPGATCNLYMRHYNEKSKEWEAPVFIAALAGVDAPDWGTEGSKDLEKVTSRVSPNGEYLAFMSVQDLTKYNNKDVDSDVPDEEIYLYKAPSADAPLGSMVCVSCNPTGERPAGVLDSPEKNEGEGLLVDQQGVWHDRWLAGVVPGWTAMELGVASYQSRYVSDTGRVFFDSSDALVPQATNGLMDVYEYEPDGIGSCGSSSGDLSEETGGCVGLISSGSSGEETAFLDASASGDDVFFLTSERLAPGDHDSAFDVYDAHVCSVDARCSAEIVSPPPCTTAEACRVAPPPQPTLFGAPASATFSGTGNFTSSSPAVRCTKDKKLSHGKCIKAKTRKAKTKSKAKTKRKAKTGRASGGRGRSR